MFFLFFKWQALSQSIIWQWRKNYAQFIILFDYNQSMRELLIIIQIEISQCSCC